MSTPIYIRCAHCGEIKPMYTANFPDLCKWCFIRMWGKER